jgi:hypothetical protein
MIKPGLSPWIELIGELTDFSKEILFDGIILKGTYIPDENQ